METSQTATEATAEEETTAAAAADDSEETDAPAAESPKMKRKASDLDVNNSNFVDEEDDALNDIIVPRALNCHCGSCVTCYERQETLVKQIEMDGKLVELGEIGGWRVCDIGGDRNDTDVVSKVVAVRLGRYIMTVVAYSPYPVLYAKGLVGELKPYKPDDQLPPVVMHHCAMCLQCTANEAAHDKHVSGCKQSHPPGIVKMRTERLLMMEIDGGNVAYHAYAQMLCLLARNFIGHKSVVRNLPTAVKKTNADGTFSEERMHFKYRTLFLRDPVFGYELIGYYSFMPNVYANHDNLSCLLVLPSHQHNGYAGLLIDDAYKTSVKSGVCGGPERPFSVKGRNAFVRYWKNTINDWFSRRHVVPTEEGHSGNVAETVASIGRDTGIMFGDALHALNLLGVVKSDAANALIDRAVKKVALALAKKTKPEEAIKFECIGRQVGVADSDVMQSLIRLGYATPEMRTQESGALKVKGA
jgi:hypothetical protein